MSALPVMLRGRRRAAPLALALACLAVAGIAAATLLGGDDKSGAPKRTSAGSTATVTRRTLVSRETVDGTLGYAGHRTVINRLAASGSESPTGSSPTDRVASTTPTAASTIPAALFTPGQEDDSSSGDSDADEPDQDQPDGDKPDNDGDDDANGSQPDGSDGSSPSGSEPSGSAPNRSGDEDTGGGGRDGSASDDDGSGDDGSGDDGSGDDGYQGTGTLTSMAPAGSVVHRGGSLYRLDGDPVVLMYGATPAYRTLEPGIADGPDVEELERNLAALGFDPGSVDETFTSATAAAISDWQESQGLDQTGSIELGRVVFMPGPRRIGEHKASVGSVLSSGAEVLDTSSTKRVVDVPLDATQQSLAHEGAAVTVTLPDGAVVKGGISKVGRVAREETGDSSDPNAEGQLVIDVTVELRSKRGIGRLDEAPVGVGLAEQSRRRVLSVPIDALVARRGGGYGVELAASHRIVPVEPGLFASGYVEVSGSGIREGTRVVVPSE